MRKSRITQLTPGPAVPRRCSEGRTAKESVCHAEWDDFSRFVPRAGGIRRCQLDPVFVGRERREREVELDGSRRQRSIDRVELTHRHAAPVQKARRYDWTARG